MKVDGVVDSCVLLEDHLLKVGALGKWCGVREGVLEEKSCGGVDSLLHVE